MPTVSRSCLFQRMAMLGLLTTVCLPLGAQGAQISGGLDLRYTHQHHSSEDKARLEGLFLNMRKVWSDDLGDRWIFTAQVDFDDNFRRIRPYQVYLQYKGPLGKWNVRAGHFLLPFGLLATYDTERLIFQGLEKTTVGVRKDTGATFFGRHGDWDFALSVTGGLGDRQFLNSKANPVLTARLAFVQSDWQVGFSSLIGRVLRASDPGTPTGTSQMRRLAIDAIKSWGPLTLRAEAVGGTDNGKVVGGSIVLGDYALTPKVELNTRYAYWRGSGSQHSVGLGFTYHLSGRLYLRIADNYEFGQETENAFTMQLYFEFSKHL